MTDSSINPPFVVDKTCRACLKNVVVLKSLIKGYLRDLFIKFTNLKIADNDGLPTKLCINCTEKLKTCSLFLELCIKSDNMLKQQKVIKSENCEEIKSETAQPVNALGNFISNFLEVNYSPNDADERNDENLILEEVKTENVNADVIIIESEENFIENTKNSNSKRVTKNVTRTSRKEKWRSSIETELLSSEASDYNLFLTCPKCGEFFSKSDQLETHYTEHSRRKEVCLICNREFSTKERLNAHIIEHNEKKDLSCSECSEKFYSEDSLRIHKKIHTENRVYICHICGKSFGKSWHLKAHTNVTHSDEKPFSCTICPHTCKTVSSLKMHMLRHAGTKKFICATCGYGSLSISNFKRHMASHSNEKPFGCKICTKRYKTEGHLAEHNRVHTGQRPYKCDLCPMGFRAGKALKDHRRLHTGEKPHVCGICGKGFAQKSALNSHSRVH